MLMAATWYNFTQKFKIKLPVSIADVYSAQLKHQVIISLWSKKSEKWEIFC